LVETTNAWDLVDTAVSDTYAIAKKHTKAYKVNIWIEYIQLFTKALKFRRSILPAVLRNSDVNIADVLAVMGDMLSTMSIFWCGTKYAITPHKPYNKCSSLADRPILLTLTEAFQKQWEKTIGLYQSDNMTWWDVFCRALRREPVTMFSCGLSKYVVDASSVGDSIREKLSRSRLHANHYLAHSSDVPYLECR